MEGTNGRRGGQFGGVVGSGLATLVVGGVCFFLGAFEGGIVLCVDSWNYLFVRCSGQRLLCGDCWVKRK